MTTRREFMIRSTQTAAFIPFMNMPFDALSADELHDPLSISIFSKHLQFLDCSSAAATAAEMGFAGLDLTVRPGGHVEPATVKKIFRTRCKRSVLQVRNVR